MNSWFVVVWCSGVSTAIACGAIARETLTWVGAAALVAKIVHMSFGVVGGSPLTLTVITFGAPAENFPIVTTDICDISRSVMFPFVIRSTRIAEFFQQLAEESILTFQDFFKRARKSGGCNQGHSWLLRCCVRKPFRSVLQSPDFILYFDEQRGWGHGWVFTFLKSDMKSPNIFLKKMNFTLFQL